MPDNSLASNVIVHAVADVPVADILTSDALAFVAALHRRLDARRPELLARREEQRSALAAHVAGTPLDFPPATAPVRVAEWQGAPAAPAPPDRGGEDTRA